jgi:hypothetical protein
VVGDPVMRSLSRLAQLISVFQGLAFGSCGDFATQYLVKAGVVDLE